MGIKNNVLKLIIVLAAMSFAGHGIAVEYQVPDSLDQMINITRRMVNELKRLDPNSQPEMYRQKRLQIANWVAVASGKRIYNCNDFWETPRNLTGCSKLEEARNTWKIEPGREWNDKRNRNEIIARWAWENETGNCEENANVTYYILKKAGVTDSLHILFSNDWHGFTVWGVQDGGDLSQPLTWNSDALVIDSWLGKVLNPYDAHHNYYIGNGGSNPLEDQTLAYDKKTCEFMDFSEGESNLCHVYTKWLRGPLDSYLTGVIVVNDELVLGREPENRWKPPLGYTPTSDRYNECRILLPQAKLDCKAANMKGIPIDIQRD